MSRLINGFVLMFQDFGEFVDSLMPLEILRRIAGED
jgi:hypothetical protein